MGDSVVKLQARHSFQPIVTIGNQAASTPVTERHSLREPPAIYPARKASEVLQTSLTPLRVEDRTTARPSSHDREKDSFERHSHQTNTVSYSHSRITYTDSEDDGDDDGPKEHAIWILIYLSALSPLLTLPLAFYSLLIGSILLLVFPLCFCLKQLRVCARFRYLLSPLLGLQLALIHSSHDLSEPVQSETSDIIVLVLISIFSPLHAIAIAVATWIAGVFWFYTAILGNPDGKEDGDDGRDAVLAVRGWWERWLMRGLETQQHFIFRSNGSESGC